NDHGPFSFTIPAPDGAPLLDAEVTPGDLASARARWRQYVTSAVLAVVAITILLCAAPLIDRRRAARDIGGFVLATTALVVLVAVAFSAAGAADVVLLWNYERLLRTIVSDTTFDLIRFSLHPLSAARLGLSFSVLLLHAAAIWTAAAIVRLPALVRRVPRSLAT